MHAHTRYLRRGSTIVATALAVGAPPAVAADTDVVAQWRFDEASGQSVRDDGPFALDGTLGLTRDADSADPARIAGASGGALRFDGAGFVRLPNSTRLAPQTLTVEAVARADRTPGRYRYLVSRGGTGCVSSSYGLYTGPTGGLAFYVFDGRRFILSASARRSDVWDGGWHTLSGSFDGTTVRLLVDGRPVGDPMVAPVSIDYSIPSSETLLGQYAGDCDLGFAGDLDSVRILSGSTHGTPPTVAPPTPTDPQGPPLPAAEPGTTLPAGAPDPGQAQPPAQSPRPSRPASACTVTLSRRTIRAHRRTIVRVRLAHAPRRIKLRVSAHAGTHRRAIATARLTAGGRARLVLKPTRTGRVTVYVVGRGGCGSAQLTVVTR